MNAVSYNPFAAMWYAIHTRLFSVAMMAVTLVGSIATWGSPLSMLWLFGVPLAWAWAVRSYTKYVWNRPTALAAYMKSVGFIEIPQPPEPNTIHLLPDGSVFTTTVHELTQGQWTLRVAFTAERGELPTCRVATKRSEPPSRSQYATLVATTRAADDVNWLAPTWKRTIDNNVTWLYALAERFKS